MLSTRTKDSTVALYHGAVERVILAMHERLDENLSLHDMAALAFISPYHFNRIFRAVIGLPPGRFLGALRLETAKRLLLTTQLSVTDVCFEVGYTSLGTFTRRFTQLMGLSPHRLRRLAHDMPLLSWEALYSHNINGSCTTVLSPGLIGRVDAPDTCTGLIFVGLFATPIPQGRPVACTLLTAPGTYHIAPVPDGRYYVFATVLSQSDDPVTQLLDNKALRGSVRQGPVVVQRGQVSGYTDVTLRSAQLTDPPLLVTLPLLLMERRDLETTARTRQRHDAQTSRNGPLGLALAHGSLAVLTDQKG
jgi:AraC-like DNA-binding protein